MNRVLLAAFLARAEVRSALVGLAIGLVLALVLPSLPGVGSGLALRTLTVCAIYALAAAGVGVLYGRLGLVSIMQIGLVAVGGWATLRIYHATHLPFEVVMVLAALVTAAVGVIVGLPALRLSGLSLAIVTLMVAGALEVLVTYAGFPNGGDGFLGRVSGGTLAVIMPRPALGQSDDEFFRYVGVVVVVVLVLLRWLLMVRPGRTWAAIRQGEAGAVSLGINTVAHRLLALAVTSAVTGVAGALLAASSGILDPTSFKAQQSVLLFATVLIGGAFSLLGAVLGGLFFYGLPQLLNTVGLDGNLVFVVLGLGLVQAVTTAPAGIAGQLGALWRRLRPPRPPRPSRPSRPSREVTV
ncbi:amino acid/amide ABC transporter membrane protein 2 (HAAT family) [Promicromonospora sp. AC04]|uniref:branched-chain amino acid ABC transporter permease n=1 Tax=Promicromonospora sp. AC04 TaxID=2135723 RepID=UPI000D3C017B|nr:branched-chain amino acid ABC transporter permease [Promicromonospora sp. AC04]PUB32036.1 amino acid/amide ABC transporter membrane protein 2 (HAAT family) [Promicromonospora sp. AC04]